MNKFNWYTYEEKFLNAATKEGKSTIYISKNLEYAKKLHGKQLPIVYDVTHLSKLIGITSSYFYEVSNSQSNYYRRFKIYKNDGSTRTIHEPLPNLKLIQQWILINILYQTKISPFAKAYIRNISIKDNVKFHKNQKIILKLDIKNFFPSIKEEHVYKVFRSFGYTTELTKMFAEISLIYARLPQGAPTSAYLSNLVLLNFDNLVSAYCVSKSIRYTRYADDMTFSGDFKIGELITFVRKELAKEKLFLNEKKTKVLRKNTRQVVTGITVNDKLQVPRPYRREIRLEVYFIRKYGLMDHLNHIKYKGLASYYTKSLLGKVKYCIYINPKDLEMKNYKKFLDEQLNLLLK